MKPIFISRSDPRLYQAIKPKYFIKFVGESYPFFDGVMEAIEQYDARQIYQNASIEVITVVQYGLYLLDRDQLIEGKKIIDWLINNLTTQSGGGSVLQIWKNKPEYSIDPPWVSGMLQGQMLSLFARYQFLCGGCIRTDNAMHLVFRSFLPMDGNYDHDFVRSGDGKIWFEEYPLREQNTYVLNGNIFAIFGIIDYYDYTNCKVALELLNRSIDSLLDKIYQFEEGGWSKYDLYKNNFASYEYHSLHIALLNSLYKALLNERFLEVADLWSGSVNYLAISKFALWRRKRQIARKIKTFFV